MWTNEIAKWDRTTGEVSRFTIPTPHSLDYGAVMDKNDNFWIAEWTACKIAKFDTNTEKFTEYTPLSKPCTMRRLSVDHNGNVWYALDSVGKIGMMDAETGKMVEYTEPVKFGFPYDIKEDHDYNLWIADSGQGGGIIKFEPRDQEVHLLSDRAANRHAQARNLQREFDLVYDAIGRCQADGARRFVSGQVENQLAGSQLLTGFRKGTARRQWRARQDWPATGFLWPSAHKLPGKLIR